MRLKKKDINKVLKKILKTLIQIDSKILKKKIDFRSKSKTEIDPVTKFDIMIEKKIKNIIKKTFPSHDIIGEETKQKLSNSPFKWYIDPIDGTKALIMGLPNWSHLIGLHFNSIPILSFIYFPVLKKLYYSSGDKSFLKSDKKITQIKSSRNTSLNKAVISMNTMKNTQNLKILEKLKRDKKFYKITGADALNYCLLSEGKIDIIIEKSLKKVDFFPILKLIKNSGAIVTDWSGKQLNKNGDVIVAGNKKIYNNFVKKYISKKMI